MEESVYSARRWTTCLGISDVMRRVSRCVCLDGRTPSHSVPRRFVMDARVNVLLRTIADVMRRNGEGRTVTFVFPNLVVILFMDTAHKRESVFARTFGGESSVKKPWRKWNVRWGRLVWTEENVTRTIKMLFLAHVFQDIQESCVKESIQLQQQPPTTQQLFPFSLQLWTTPSTTKTTPPTTALLSTTTTTTMAMTKLERCCC